MQKNKKLVTESGREGKRMLRIAESPKKVGKLKLSSMLEASKAKELEQINEAVRQKLEEPMSASKVKTSLFRIKAIILTRAHT